MIDGILALDLGTNTGWAMNQRGVIVYGTVNFATSRYEGGGMRYLKFLRWLGSMVNADGKPHAVWFEEVRRHKSTDAAHVYGGLMGVLTSWAESEHVPYDGVPVGTVKKYATGKGNANKDAMVAAITARGYHPEDDNQADAIAILLWAQWYMGGMSADARKVAKCA